jgi:hypothetical protein
VSAGSTPDDLDSAGSGCMAHHFDHRSVGLVLLRGTRDSNLDTVAVNANNSVPAGIGHDQKIDFDTVGCVSNRIADHQLNVALALWRLDSWFQILGSDS